MSSGEARGGQETRGGAPALEDWVARVAAELGVRGDVDVRQLLDLTREVAHRVDRPAAPLTTFLVGLAAGASGGDVAAVERAVAAVRGLLPAEA